jgi:hypothetical protein
MKLFHAFEEQPIQGDTSVVPEPDIWQDDLVVPPGDNEPSTNLEIITLVGGDFGRHEAVTDEELFGTNIVPGELPDIKANVIMVEEDKAKIANLKDLEATITTRGSVSRDDAIAVEDIFGGFVSGFHSLNCFSRAPSRVNYDQTSAYMVRRIAAEEEAGCDHITSMVKTAVEYAKSLSAKADDKLVGALVEQVDSLKNFIQDHPLSVSHGVFPMNGSFLNVLTAPIKELNLGEISWGDVQGDPKAKEDIKAGLAGLQARMGNSSIYVFLEASRCDVSGGTTFSNLYDTHYAHAATNGFPMTVQEIMTCYSEGNIEKLLKCCQKALEDTSHYFQNLQTQCQEESGDYNMLSDLMRNENTQFEHRVRSLEMANDVLNRLPYINYSLGRLVSGFAHLHQEVTA